MRRNAAGLRLGKTAFQTTVFTFCCVLDVIKIKPCAGGGNFKRTAAPAVNPLTTVAHRHPLRVM
jgi:hypothetical protein